jgi:hypothetical protein
MIILLRAQVSCAPLKIYGITGSVVRVGYDWRLKYVFTAPWDDKPYLQSVSSAGGFDLVSVVRLQNGDSSYERSRPPCDRKSKD